MKKEQKIKLFTSSFILNILAILLAFTVFQANVFLLAKFFKIPVGLDGFVVAFRVTDGSALWTSSSITAIFGLPPFISFALSVIARKIYENRARKKKTNLKLFLIWASLHFDNLFLGSILAGLLTRSGFSYFLSWIYIPYFVQIMIAIVAAILLFLKAPYLNYGFSQSAPSSHFINKKTHKQYKRFLVYFPYLAGVVVLSALLFPNFTIHEIILKATPIIAFIGMRKYIDCEDVKMVKGSLIFSANYALLIPITLFFLAFYLVL